MKISLSTLLTLLFFTTSSVVFAAIPAKKEEAKLLEELTGKKAAVPAKNVTPVQPQKMSAVASAAKAPSQKTISRKLLDSGFFAYTKKDYISALKHYNTIIVKYPKSQEYRLAYLAKAKLYNEMGLAEQAQLNLKIANDILSKTQNTK